jgi:hypothetical protein
MAEPDQIRHFRRKQPPSTLRRRARRFCLVRDESLFRLHLFKGILGAVVEEEEGGRLSNGEAIDEPYLH